MLTRARRAPAWLDDAHPRQVTIVWALTRLSMFVILLLPAYPADPVTGDTTLYRQWAEQMVTGQFPVDDDRWQYPPLAALMIVPPHLPGTAYAFWFMLFAVLLDLLVLRLLLRGGRAAKGAWYWTAGLFLLGPVGYFRFDLLVTAVAVCALLVIARSRVFGAVVAVGVLIKVWPAILLMSLPRDRSGFRAVIASALTAAGIVGAVSLVADGQWGFLQGQSGRGIEIEAVPAVPFHVARLFGWSGSIEYRYGSWELLGPGVRTAGEVSMGLTLAGLAFAAVIAWRRRPDAWTPAFGCDLALAATLIVTVTSRVLSPQYMIWIIGVAAVCLVHRDTRQRPVAVLVLAAVAITHLEFPIAWHAARDGDPLAIGIVTVRDLVLIAALAVSIRRLWAGPASGPASGAASGADEVRAGRG
ncbi:MULTISPECIES: glycosyltransferase 87 family protein [unclassified Spirillospora]|uniref:glycosyltransferase 87 family protein n=1 Tax=unclassified Spirillospora TaxID=2642701 RepID=UPI003716489C